MESNHEQAVDDLADVYDRKLDVECGNFLRLEQEKLEMKKHYEQRIADIKRQNQKAIDKLLGEFKSNMVKVEGEYVDSKKTGKTVQEIYDKQLDRMEDGHEDQIIDIKQNHAEDRKSLKATYELYVKEQEKIKEEKRKLEASRKKAEVDAERARVQKKQAMALLEERNKQITMLEQEK